jgi:hypothetical protein
MLKLLPQLVLLTVHGKAREAEYRAAFQTVEKAANETAVEDAIFVRVGDRPVTPPF